MFKEEIVFAKRIEKEIDELLREKVETTYCPAPHNESILELHDADKGVRYESVNRQNERVLTVSATPRESDIYNTPIHATTKMDANTLSYSNHNYYTLETIKSRFIFSSKLERILKRIHKKLEASAHKEYIARKTSTIKHLSSRMDTPKGTCTRNPSKPKLASYDLGSSEKMAPVCVNPPQVIGVYYE